MNDLGARKFEGSPEEDHRLGEISERMLERLEADGLFKEGDRGIVMLSPSEGSEERAAIGMHGFEDQEEAMAIMLLHLRAIFEANGKTLLIAPLGSDN